MRKGPEPHTSTLQTESSFGEGVRFAVEAATAWLGSGGKADEAVENLGWRPAPVERRRGEFLFWGMVRQAVLLRSIMAESWRMEPAGAVGAVIYLGAFEVSQALTENDEPRVAKAVNFWVDAARGVGGGPGSAALANALLRKLPESWRARREAAKRGTPEAVAIWHSHPAWLVRRWSSRWDADIALKLMEWNQSPPETYARLTKGVAPTAGMELTAWEDFVKIKAEAWPVLEKLLAEGKAYVMDPASRLPVATCPPLPGMKVLDLCASPGGKSRMAADALAGTGTLVAVDLPGRTDRLRENLAKVTGTKVSIQAMDVLKLSDSVLRMRGLPEKFDRIYLDAPCSNTGVLRRRPDAKFRLDERDIRACAALQSRLLAAAAPLAAPGGRLIYSTCSLEEEENLGRVENFLACPAGAGWQKESQVVSRPWESGHDGGGVFVLKKN